ncbi:hypothetical protein C8R44DRAFT_748373 [Mycena epipterygia]|nr:hypothetical protein C8R44DRAFT_748373 [Mycena epipterygia]
MATDGRERDTAQRGTEEVGKGIVGQQERGDGGGKRERYRPRSGIAEFRKSRWCLFKRHSDSEFTWNSNPTKSSSSSRTIYRPATTIKYNIVPLQSFPMAIWGL